MGYIIVEVETGFVDGVYSDQVFDTSDLDKICSVWDGERPEYTHRWEYVRGFSMDAHERMADKLY